MAVYTWGASACRRDGGKEGRYRHVKGEGTVVHPGFDRRLISELSDWGMDH